MSTTQNKETYTSINYVAVKNHLREWQEGSRLNWKKILRM